MTPAVFSLFGRKVYQKAAAGDGAALVWRDEWVREHAAGANGEGQPEWRANGLDAARRPVP